MIVVLISSLFVMLVICVVMIMSPNFITIFMSNLWGRIYRLKAHDPIAIAVRAVLTGAPRRG